VTSFERAEDGEPRRLSDLLRRCRARLDPQLSSLGSLSRLPLRIGRPVTQEEVAEAVGISRQWYAMLESDRAGRVSAAVLSRLADALMMDPGERAVLFRLAVPELRLTSLPERSTGVLEAFRALRRLTLRLWAATTETEALTLVREHAMTMLAPDAMVTCTRVGDGSWVDAATGEDDACGSRFHALLRRRWGDAAEKALHGYRQTARQGELMIRSERDGCCPDLAAVVRRTVEPARPSVSFATASVQSQRGFFARLTVVHFAPHEYSEMERAQLGGLADLACLALSGLDPLSS